MMRRLHAVAVTACLVTAACGPPEPIDMRQKFSEGIQRLGVAAVYPPKEEYRIGQVHLVDMATLEPGAELLPYVPNSDWVSDAAVPFMEKFRGERMAAKNRFPCSSEKLSTQIVLSGTPSYYQQGDCPAAGGAGAGGSSKTDAANQLSNTINITLGAATEPTKPSPAATNKPSEKKSPESLPSLALAGLPSYSLASIDNMTAAAAVPTMFANFAASLGISRSTSLVVQAEGVETASLPAEEFAKAIQLACSTDNNAFGNPAIARPFLVLSDQQLRSNVSARAMKAKKALSYKPALFMLRTVYYLRGIRYIYNDTQAYAIMLQAAADAKLSAGQAPPALPNISMNVATGSQPGTTKTDALSAQLASLQAQMDAMRNAMINASGVQLAGSYSRITARGVEFVDLFQRPVAFGYLPFAQAFPDDFKERGFGDFCADARGTPVTTPAMVNKGG